ncbi:ABC transporter substrate-binding protein [Solibacillus sp. R5-41]|uniref:ABC transporter substrate-binding protein n=1 Tax=Solibacillus sp. R5-41 TaxID=2048654 RepID=UPI000C128C99|nr:ABC transporter substrate-binding protein [Solibacillus sp. R5-41]ATP40650.1 ABC transporter substrate-binding protein [Solibacillus sp. R5-41]
MDKLLGCFGIIIVVSLVISIILNFWTYIAGFFGIFIVIGFLFLWNQKRKEQQALETKQQQQIDAQNTIEYKMERLLTLTKDADPKGMKRQQYLHKEQYTLRDYWYKYLDLRAKLLLNNTPTHREEAVLHLMCDELLARMDNLEIEVQDSVKKEFIEEHLTPLLQDIVNIMDGINPTQTINIDAYQLLKTAIE